jgi:predicted RNA-binding Zn ribbon-like protein
MDTEFVLLGDALWLDFVNTAAETGARADTMPDLAAYHRWTKACRLPSDADAVEFTTVRRVRARLALLAEALIDGTPPPSRAITTLNQLLQRRPGHEHLVRESGKWQVRFLPGQSPAALVAIARSAAATLAETDVVLRRCASAGCRLRFQDRSPFHDRYWCTPLRPCSGVPVERRRGQLR